MPTHRIPPAIYTVNRHRARLKFIRSHSCVPPAFTAESPSPQSQWSSRQHQYSNGCCLEDHWLCGDGLSAVNAGGMQLCDLINLRRADGINRWTMTQTVAKSGKYEVTIRYSWKPSSRRAPTKAERAVLGTQHFEHLHNTSVDLMASDDHDERLRGALAVALVVFLTCERRHRART